MSVTVHPAGDIADFFIDIANKQFVDEDGVAEGITNLKLQKILYFAQAAHLSMYGKPLFNEEIEAWKFGPVVASIYRKYKSQLNKTLPQPKHLKELPNDLKIFLESIWNIYGKFSAAELVNITHNHEPWKIIFYGADSKKIISKSMLEEYYKRYFVVDEQKKK